MIDEEARAEQRPLAETYDIESTGIFVAPEALEELRSISKIGEMPLDAETAAVVAAGLEQITARRGEIGLAALRAAGFDPVTADYTIDETTGEIVRLVRKADA